MSNLPFILEATPEAADGLACHCLCGARHPLAPRVCEGWIESMGVRIFFNSVHAPGGVLVCQPCAAAYPELREVSS